jgi:16S rRNA (adenine(1408)-N(1))-methyltransferase
VAAPSDNSTEDSLNSLLPRTGAGIVIDLGTGDGRFVLRAARKHPNKFFIGVDANAKPLEKPSMKATRKPGRGGLANALFVQAAVEDLPGELDGVADEVHIHFPWGSLLGALGAGDARILASLRRVCATGAMLEIVIGVDTGRDRSELMRLGLSATDDGDIAVPIRSFETCGFELVEHRQLSSRQWALLETAWARKLTGNPSRKVTYLLFRAV